MIKYVKYWQSSRIYLYLSPMLKLHNQSYVKNTGVKIEPTFFSVGVTIPLKGGSTNGAR